jgi:hypothetical protein
MSAHHQSRIAPPTTDAQTLDLEKKKKKKKRKFDL